MSTFVLKREYALQLPNNYVEIDRDEMEYVDGGEITIAAAIAMIGGLIAAGYGTINIGKECGTYVYNNGGARNGSMMKTFKIAGGIVGGVIFGGLFAIGLDNGWVAASK
ncbi:class IIb bacteriocin, lactobin A/cerein 7B family [Clostridium sp.]|uniref:class IIb bacteriocin, lactobin A/cerein 7B family n=1 Tax=Clostridium sp. TaxID=1506 RepID=UPI0025CFD9DE|nr:class IIb bacteriocin, lactobin A/cerein 7B family [Clostridium sp.]MDY2632284.1 class IIb bacteriocin, lactobin A/cerein 7B family [Clostridium sp.]